MAKVSVDMGLTLALPGGDKFEFIRPQVSVQEIDVTRVDEELELVRTALPKVWEEASKQIEELIQKELPDLEKKKTESIVIVLKALSERVKILEGVVIKIQKKS